MQRFTPGSFLSGARTTEKNARIAACPPPQSQQQAFIVPFSFNRPAEESLNEDAKDLLLSTSLPD
jgi:hypothetical protein